VFLGVQFLIIHGAEWFFEIEVHTAKGKEPTAEMYTVLGASILLGFSAGFFIVQAVYAPFQRKAARHKKTREDSRTLEG
jgi:hypothetical protein